jgi:hypothetical protein
MAEFQEKNDSKSGFFEIYPPQRSGNPDRRISNWMPASAGMTGITVNLSKIQNLVPLCLSGKRKKERVRKPSSVCDGHLSGPNVTIRLERPTRR